MNVSRDDVQVESNKRLAYSAYAEAAGGACVYVYVYVEGSAIRCDAIRCDTIRLE